MSIFECFSIPGKSKSRISVYVPGMDEDREWEMGPRMKLGIRTLLAMNFRNAGKFEEKKYLGTNEATNN